MKIKNTVNMLNMLNTVWCINSFAPIASVYNNIVLQLDQHKPAWTRTEWDFYQSEIRSATNITPRHLW